MQQYCIVSNNYASGERLSFTTFGLFKRGFTAPAKGATQLCILHVTMFLNFVWAKSLNSGTKLVEAIVASIQGRCPNRTLCEILINGDWVCLG
jgi:hypothetical protein